MGQAGRSGAVVHGTLENLSDGFPSGRIGLYSDTAGVTWDKIEAQPQGWPGDGLGRWATRNRGDFSKQEVWIGTSVHKSFTQSVLRGVRADRFEVTLKLGRYYTTQPIATAQLVFDWRGPDDYDVVWLKHADTAAAPAGCTVSNGKVQAGVSGTGVVSEVPTVGSAAALWYRVVCDGSNVKVYAATTEAGLATRQANDDDCYTSDGFDIGGGQLGLAGQAGFSAVDDLTIKTDRDANGSYETTEAVEAFTTDTHGQTDAAPTHDAAGNLTYDGVFAYTYDAWNRPRKVTKAYRAPGTGTLAEGSVVNEMEYDATGRRIVKAVKNSADLDCTYHYYYGGSGGGQSVVEERDGSDNVLRQNVWGLQYIDELVQTSLNADPDDANEDDVETDYFALHNASYNVVALVDSSGGLVERYEYTPYGQRQVYLSAGANDPLAMSPTSMSQRFEVSSVSQPFGLNPFGHQGLYHDEETGLVYNRVRMLLPRLGRFLQRDPTGYPDGMNAYASYHTMHGGLDPTGLDSIGVEAVSMRADGSLELLSIADLSGSKEEVDPECIKKVEVEIQNTPQIVNIPIYNPYPQEWLDANPGEGITKIDPSRPGSMRRKTTWLLPYVSSVTVTYTDGRQITFLGSPTAFDAGTVVVAGAGAKSAVGAINRIVGADVLTRPAAAATDDVVRFAHGTSLQNAENIAKQGISVQEGLKHAVLPSANPGSLFTHQIFEVGDEGWEAAKIWAAERHIGDDLALIKLEIPTRTFDSLVDGGGAITRPVPGLPFFPPETIFKPSSFDVLNDQAIIQFIELRRAE